MRERLIVLIQCLTKDRASSGNIKPIGYLVQDLINPLDGKIKYGTFTSHLLSPPISFRSLERNPSPRTMAQVNFSILEPETDRQNTAQFIPNNEK